jgi:hypothetical protein
MAAGVALNPFLASVRRGRVRSFDSSADSEPSEPRARLSGALAYGSNGVRLRRGGMDARRSPTEESAIATRHARLVVPLMLFAVGAVRAATEDEVKAIFVKFVAAATEAGEPLDAGPVVLTIEPGLVDFSHQMWPATFDV